MLIDELFAAIREKEETLHRIKAEAQQIEKEIETLHAAVKILEREAKSGPATTELNSASTPRASVPETIRKAFP